MAVTYSITQGQAQFPRIVKESRDALVPITHRGETVAYVVGRERIDAIVETLEILSHPAAMQAIREHKEGRTQFVGLEDLAP